MVSKRSSDRMTGRLRDLRIAPLMRSPQPAFFKDARESTASLYGSPRSTPASTA